MGLFDDDDTPEYMRDSSGDDEYLSGAAPGKLERPGTAPAGGSSGTRAAQMADAERQKQAEQDAYRARQAELEAKTRQQQLEEQKKREAAARLTGSQPGKLTVVQGGGGKAPTAPPTKPGVPVFIPSTPADIAAVAGGAGPSDVGYALPAVDTALGRPTWQYVAGGVALLGGLFVVGRYVVPRFRR